MKQDLINEMDEATRDASSDELKRMFRMTYRKYHDCHRTAQSCAITIIFAVPLLILWIWL